ncbi:MAG: tyrosine-protein phosphatase [Chloroflexota bacterium]
MVDLHNHILPGVDDGAPTLDAALAMARVAQADGITTVVATPHRNPWAYHDDRADAERRLGELRAACGQAGIAIELRLGGEAHIAPDLVEQVQTGLALTINEGRFLLVEWPYDQYPEYSEQVIFDLQVRGIVPIVAHAERYRIVRRDPSYLATLVERGVLIQVTASSLLGEFGPATRKLTEILLTHGLAQVIASDSHAVDRRPPVLSAARDRAAELVGEARARALVVDVPSQVVDNQAIDLPPPKPYKPQPFWAFWRSGS